MTRYTLILDLDETLVHVKTTSILDPDFTFKGRGTTYYAIKRPHLDEFINSIIGKYNIIIWSAGLDFYVDAIVREIFPENAIPDLIYSRDFCDIRPEDNYTIKPMSKLSGMLPCEDHTLFIDDNPSTFSKNPENALWIKPFTGQKCDDVLSQLKDMLNDLYYYPVKASSVYKSAYNHCC